MARLGLIDAPAIGMAPGCGDAGVVTYPETPAAVFSTDAEKNAARVVLDIIGQYEVKRDLVPTSGALLEPEVQRKILAEATERLRPVQGDLLAGADEVGPVVDLAAVVAKTTQIVVQQTIDIPRIAVVPTGNVTTGYHPFRLDVSHLNLQPGERDAIKWFKPAKGQFQIYYTLGVEQPEYVPDFVVETDTQIFMVETKARVDLNTPEVQAKAEAAVRWCQHASDYAAGVGSKPWKYLLVPHDEVNESRRLSDFVRHEVKQRG